MKRTPASPGFHPGYDRAPMINDLPKEKVALKPLALATRENIGSCPDRAMARFLSSNFRCMAFVQRQRNRIIAALSDRRAQATLRC